MMEELYEDCLPEIAGASAETSVAFREGKTSL
jgi:hypothetical protein